MFNAEEKAGTEEGTGTAKKRKKKSGLKEPDPKNQKKPANARRRAPANYTDEEKEDAGMEVVRQVLGLEIKDMVDIRNQHNVGADAIDELRNFYELKVHAHEIPDQIRLQDSEIQRAYETEKFFLVLVGNVEAGSAPTQVRVITDPQEAEPERHGSHCVHRCPICEVLPILHRHGRRRRYRTPRRRSHLSRG